MQGQNLETVFAEMKSCAIEAGNMMMNHHKLKIGKKGANNFVTDVDKDIQLMIIQRLKKIAPEATFVAEEKENPEGAIEEGFVIDPIDGTHNFINGLPFSSVCIAYVQNDNVTFSIVFNPFRQEMFTAERDKGAFLNGQRIFCEERELENALILTEDSWNGDKAVMRKYATGYRCLGSAELALCYVACGRAGGYISQPIHIWDYAAGKLILEEAGGIIVEKDGNAASLKEPNQVGACCKTDLDTLLKIWHEAENN